MIDTKPWTLKKKPLRWQLEALSKWSLEYRGVLSVATGAGKTFFAFLAMLNIRSNFPECKFIIVVPTVPLLDQWYVSIKEELGLTDSEIALMGGGWSFEQPKLVNIIVMKSALNKAPELMSQGEYFLIVDECHKAGSEVNKKLFEGFPMATLGLSATPHREYDDWFSEYVSPELGPVIYEYDHLQAMADGVITKFDVQNVQVPLTEDEDIEVSKKNKQIAIEISSLKKLKKKVSIRLKKLLLQRSSISKHAEYRIPTVMSVIEQFRGRQGIVFHEYIEDAEHINESLLNAGYRSRVYHSRLHKTKRAFNLELFRRGVIDILVTCTALDEGIDIPHASFAIIASSTNTKRQRIQRIGRVVRSSVGKEKATVVTLYTLDSERDFLEKEVVKAGEFLNIRWFTSNYA